MRQISITVPRSFYQINPDTLPAIDALQTPVIVCAMVFHAALGVMIHIDNRFGMLQVMSLFVGGVLWLANNKADRVLYVIGYISGAEILWRVTGSAYFFEFSKYAVGLLCILLMAKNHNFGRGWSALPLYYFILMLPSILLDTNNNLTLNDSRIPLIDEIFVALKLDREQIAFNLSGPFVLAAATTYFSTIKMTRDQIIKLLLVILLPVIGMLSVAIYTTVTAQQLYFYGSNKITSGGAGPNQVSSVLGLGALMAFWLFILLYERKFLRLVLLGLGIAFMVQSALTFSRGGFWTGAVALGTGFVFLLNNPRYRVNLLIAGIFIFLVATYFIFPTLESFTGGTLSNRFRSFDSTGRDQLIAGELRAFMENPIFGAGSVKVREYRLINNRPVAHNSHTEYTRMLAEHGMLGIMALLILLVLVSRRFFSTAPLVQKSMSLSFTMWALLFMGHAALRLAAPSFIFGLGAVTWVETDAPDTKPLPASKVSA